MKLSAKEKEALIAVHRGGMDGMRIPGVVMVACSTVNSLFRKGAFGRDGLTARFAAIARELSDAEHYSGRD